MTKQAGLLFPISALPNRYGVGDFGKYAYALVDKMSRKGIHLWQILPLNPLGYGNSPYQPLSTHAGDELYLDLDDFVKEGLLKSEEVAYYNSQMPFVAYQDVRKVKEVLYQKAFSRFQENADYQQFVQDNSWVYDYALFKVFKMQNHEKSWVEWEEEYKFYPQDHSFSLIPFTKDIHYQMFLQYYFFKQWESLRAYAHEKDISIIGDMPIYVGLDSVDVWMNQKCFLLEEDGTPSFVAGVPPDYFSKFGQRWGNPIYDWDYLEETQFAFWVERMRAATKMYDTVRIDHFRAFDTYWKIPASEATAIIGEWVEAPGYKLFDTLFKEIPQLSVLAEDLGELRDEVYELRDHYHLKGMYVFQFHHAEKFDFDKVLVYTGTHDNDTLVGWFKGLDEEEQLLLEKLLKKYNEEETYQKIIHYCLDLDAKQVIIPVWDMMGADSSSRFNVPGKIGSPNWEYRLTSFDEFDEYMEIYSHMIEKSHRKEG